MYNIVPTGTSDQEIEDVEMRICIQLTIGLTTSPQQERAKLNLTQPVFRNSQSCI